MNRKLFIDKDKLTELYYKNNYTQIQLANYFDCSPHTIFRFFPKNNINKKSISEAAKNRKKREPTLQNKILSKKLLYNEYIIKKLTIEQIGNNFNCGRQTVANYLKKFDILIRSHSESLLLKHTNKKIPLSIINQFKCVDCGKELNYYKSIRCLKCSNSGDQNTMFGIHRFGKDSPNFKHGMSGLSYPHAFKIKKDKIYNRDNFTCQCCNLTKEEHYLKYNQNLHVHHIDYNKFNNYDTNLITLCCYCNLKANGDRDYWFAYYTHLIGELI